MADISLDILTLFAAITTDKDKAARLAEIQAEIEKQQAILDEIRTLRAEAEATAEVGRKDKADALKLITDVEQREAALKAETEGLANAIKSHNDEVKQFAEIREKIELEQATREDAVDQAEMRQASIEIDHAKREKDLREREATVAKLAESLDRKHGALKEAMAA